MILFHHIDDTDTPEKFKKTVAKELLGETRMFVCVYPEIMPLGGFMCQYFVHVLFTFLWTAESLENINGISSYSCIVPKIS